MDLRERIARIIADNREHPRFKGRRSIDKACGEIIEVTQHDYIPHEGFPVIERIDLPNFAGEAAACERAQILSDIYTATGILEVIENAR